MGKYMNNLELTDDKPDPTGIEPSKNLRRTFEAPSKNLRRTFYLFFPVFGV